MAQAQQIPLETPDKNSVRHFDNWLQAYENYTDNTEAPRSFHAWTGISVLGAALARKCWVNVGRFTLYPSFYITFVAPPGIATKSTTAGMGMDLLEEAGVIRKFDGSLTWQSIIDELQDASGQVTVNNKRLEMASLQLFASELGVLLSSGDSGEMIDMFVDLWDGKPRFKRRTRGGGVTEIARPFLNMLACTTPSWLAKNAANYVIDGGFFSRTIFVYADKKAKYIAYPDDTADPDMRGHLVADLKRIAQLCGEFTITDEARAWGDQWYVELHENPPEHLANEMFQFYRSRRQAHLHKVAMVLSAARSTEQVIDIEDMVIAESLLVSMEKDLANVYEAVVAAEKVESYKLIVKGVRTNPGVLKTDLFRNMASKVTYHEFEAGINAAIFARDIKLKQVGGDILVYPVT